LFSFDRIGNIAMLAFQEPFSNNRDSKNMRQCANWAVRSVAATPFGNSASAPLRALADNDLEDRYRNWLGASGRRYVFSVYDRETCPAYNFAVLVVAAVGRNGERRILFVADTGCFPDLVLAKATAMRAEKDETLEFHVHLLAHSLTERCALIEDISQPRWS
jgi:hypothetical protein